jgi:hypothetical protein
LKAARTFPEPAGLEGKGDTRRHHVELIYYSARNGGPDERLRRVIDLFFPRDSSGIYGNAVELSGALRRVSDPSTIILIHAISKDDLRAILEMKDLLMDRKIILILPDRDTSTIAMGHTLRPRLLSFEDSDFFEIAAVLTRMTEQKGEGMIKGRGNGYRGLQ